jgi:hypothetical protein
MKHNLKYVIFLVFMLLLTQSTWADPAVTIIKQLNGSPAATTSPGEVAEPVIANGKCTLTVTPAQGNYVTKDFITAYSVVKGDVAQTPRRSPDLDNEPIEVHNAGENTDPSGVTTYEFTMPADGTDVEVTVNFHSITTYNLFIGSKQVTELNAADVLGDGTVTFSVGGDAAIVYTLTLNGAELTVPVKVGLDNLTIDIQGTNSITTSETCIQKMDNTNPSLIFKSTGTEVGSLSLNGSSGVYGVGYGTFSISDQFAVILKKDGYYYSNQYNFTDGSTKEALLAPSYGLTVGGMQIYEGNATDVIGDGIGDGDDSGMVSFDKATNTLTLKNANLSGIIRSSLPNLTIELEGNSSIYSSGDRTLQAGSAVNMTIQSTAGNGSLSMHKSYSSTELGNFVDDNVNLTIATPLSVISGKLSDTNQTNNYYATIGINYDLWISGTRVTSANASNIWDGADFEFDAENSILYYRDGASTAYPILSGLPNLTIKIGSPDAEGDYAKNNIGVIKFGAPESETIAATSGTLTISKILDDAETVQQFQIVGSGEESNIIQGFTTVDYSDFVPMADGITYNTETKKLVDANGSDWGETTTFVTSNGVELPAPAMNGEAVAGADGISLILSTDLGTIKYSVDYVDSNEADITDATYDDNNRPTISKPATVTAYVTINGHNSTTTKGKYFNSNPSPFKLVYGADPIDLVLAPAIEESDGIAVTAFEANVTYNQETGKISSSTALGSFGGPCAMSSTEGKTVILNNYFTMNFEVVPPAPTITSSATLEGDAITIESTVAGADIYYSWSADDNTGTLYTTTAPTAKTGILYAWAKVTTENGTVTSDKATKEFSVKKNLANAYVPDFTISVPYTGSAIVPEFSVYESATSTSPISSDNYTITYRNIGGDKPTVVESIVNAGTYDIEIIAKESSTEYGGSQVICEEFTVTKATPEITFAQESYSATLGETFTSPATVDDWTVSPTASSNTSVATISEGQIVLVGVGTTTITVTYAGDDNHNSATGSYQLVVMRDLGITFEGTNSWATYYATENLAVPEGLTAYVVSDVNETSGAVTVASVGYLPKDNAVLLERASGASASGYVAAQYTGTTDEVTNMLEGHEAPKPVSEIEGTVYVLYNNVFKRTTSGTIPARRGYLILNAPESPTLNIVFDTTVIGTLTVGPDTDTDNWYTIDGLKLNGKPQREGLYINNGKKVFIKK